MVWEFLDRVFAVPARSRCYSCRDPDNPEGAMNRAVGLLVPLVAAGSLSFAQPEPPKLRLGDAVRPVRQALEIELVPEQTAFAGTAEIDLEVRAETPVLWLNASGLTVREATLAVGEAVLPARVVPGDEEVLGFALGRPIPPGPARLRVVYEGPISRRDVEGFFAQQEGDDWYAFTQFEPAGARRAFPCFDEPSFKVPWRLTLRVRRDHLALSNTPAVSEVEGTGGMKAVTFAETRPLPSYVVAFAVGPFEAVDAGRTGRRSTPVRIVTPRGKGREARWAAESTVKILPLLEEYFDTPYPYEKLDQAAIPVFFGAMEHPGLVTYGQTLLLQKPEEETVRRRRAFAETAAHELAHQWFGNLVTMAWWDDVWLNESFASWMASKIADRFRPEWDEPVSAVASRSWALGADSLATARRIRQPIASRQDIANAFDGITYAKGEAVLTMFESWLGEETFRRGVRRYLAAHAWKTGTAADFLGALSAESGRDVSAPFSTFLDQTGAPLVSADLRCSEGGPPRLALAQSPYRPLGSRDTSPKAWQVPVCFRYGAGPAVAGGCTLLASASAEVALGTAATCPDWVLANDGWRGYYRVRHRGDLLGRLVADGGHRLTAAERVGLVGDLGAMVASGDLPVSEALALVAPLARDPHRQVVAATIGVVQGLAEMVPERLRPVYAAFLRDLYRERAKALGWTPAPGEDEEARLLRQSLISIVAVHGEDADLGAEALGLARRWLDDAGAVHPDMVETVLPIAGRYGDRALFERLRSAATASPDRQRRQRLIWAMGSIRDPAILRSALALALEDGLDPRESIRVVWAATADPATRPLAWSFVKENFEALVERQPEGTAFSAGAYFPRIGVRFCDAERREELRAFFEPRSPRFAGGPRILQQVLETIDLCVAQRRAQEPSIASFLEARGDAGGTRRR